MDSLVLCLGGIRMQQTENRNKFIIFIAALFFAVIFWLFVMTNSNPKRIKDLKNISIEVRGQEVLNGKGLIIHGKSSESVTVRMEGLSDSLSNVKADNIEAYIDVSKIDSAGKHKLTVQVINMSNSVVSVKSVNSSEITVDIAEHLEKDVPIEVKFDGDIPADYWFGEVSLEPERAHISGAKQDVAPISKAICRVPVSSVLESYESNGTQDRFSANINLEFVDENGNKLDFDIKKSAIVTLKVARKKVVPVDFSNSYTGNVAKGYTVKNVSGNLEFVEIIGSKEILDTISKVSVVPITLNSERSQVVRQTTFVAPQEGVSVLGDGTIILTIEIAAEE